MAYLSPNILADESVIDEYGVKKKDLFLEGEISTGLSSIQSRNPISSRHLPSI